MSAIPCAVVMLSGHSEGKMTVIFYSSIKIPVACHCREKRILEERDEMDPSLAICVF